MFGAAAAMAVALVALTVSAHWRRETMLTQKLFDVDGPSVRDPSKAAWDKGGKVRGCLPNGRLLLLALSRITRRAASPCSRVQQPVACPDA